MKKWFSIMVIALLLFSGNHPSISFAEGESTADLLFKYGFIVGDNGDLMVDQNLTRAQACVLLSEMYGQKTEASKYIFIQNFSDVHTNDWFAPYVTFAKTNKWISGYPDGTFKPNNSVSRQEWSAMLMNALKYSYKWENVILDMNTIGIDFTAKNPLAIKRGEAFDGMWRALLTPAQGNAVALGIELKKLPESILAGGETDTESPGASSGTLEVVSYRAVGLNELEFVFNKKLESGNNLLLSNITMKQDTNFFLKPAKIDLTDDQMGIRVVSNVPIIQNKAMDITLNNIVATDGSKLMEKVFHDVKFMDTVLPQMMTAEIIGDYYIKIDFNEPVQSDEDIAAGMDADNIPELSISDFIVNEGHVNLNSIKLTDNNKTAIVFTNTKLTEDAVITAKNSIKDFAGFNLYSTQITAKYVKDITPPKVVAARVISPKRVVVIWDENIKPMNRYTNQYYHDSPKNSIDGKLTDEKFDGKEVTLDFSGKPLSPGANTIYLLNGSVTDYYGNQNLTESIVVELEPDKVNPTVVGEVDLKDQKTIVIQFSEAMRNQANELYVKSNYDVRDANNISTVISQTIYDSKQNTVTLYFEDELLGTYTIKFNNLYDLAGNALVDKGHQFTARDMKLPTSASWKAKVFFTGNTEQDVIVFFDEPMMTTGTYSILDKSKYRINGRALSQLSASAVKLNLIDEQTLQISVATPANGGMNIEVDRNDSASSSDLTIGRVSNLIGNTTETEENFVDLEEKANIEVLGFRYIGNEQCEIVLSERVPDIDTKDFEIFKNGEYYNIKDYFITYNDKGQSIVTVSLDKTINAYQGFFLRAAGQNTKTKFGETLNPMSGYIQLTEHIGATLSKITTDSGYVDNVSYSENSGIVMLEFTKVINANSVFMLSYEIPGIEIEKITATGAFVQIYVAKEDRSKVRQYMSVIQKYPMKDVNDITIEGILTRIEILK